MTDIVERLRALEAAATKGPWVRQTLEPQTFGYEWIDAPSHRHVAVCRDLLKRDKNGYAILRPELEEITANTEFIVAMRNALPDLLAEIGRLREESAYKDEDIVALRQAEDRWIARLSILRMHSGDNGRMMLADFSAWFEKRWTELLAAESALREKDAEIERLTKECAELAASLDLTEQDMLRMAREKDATIEAMKADACVSMEEYLIGMQNEVEYAKNMREERDAAEARAQSAEQRVAELTEALEPFAEVGLMIEHYFGEALFPDNSRAFNAEWSNNGNTGQLTWANFRKARAALASLNTEKTDG